MSLVSGSTAAGLTVRIVGSTGIRLHCPDASATMDAVERPAKDIDLVVRHGDRGKLRDWLEARGWIVDRDMLVAMEGERYAFHHPDAGLDAPAPCDAILRRRPVTSKPDEERSQPILSRTHAWLLALTATLTMAVSYVDRQALAAIAPTVSKAFDISEPQYGWLVSAFSFAWRTARRVKRRWRRSPPTAVRCAGERPTSG